MRLSAFLRHCRFLTVAALGAMLAFPASAQTGSESGTPSAGTPGAETPSQSSTGSESQTPSTAIPGSETQSESPGAPTSSNPAIAESNSASKTRGYAPCDLFHATGTQHSWFGPSWPWHERISWVCPPHAFERDHSLSTRPLGRHGEDEGCRQRT